MKCAVLNDMKHLSIEDRKKPDCPADGLLLQVKTCAVCATDVKIYNYGHQLIKLPRVLGHEVAGIVVFVGQELGNRFKVGQRIALCAVINCGKCIYCQRNVPSMCEKLEAFGYHYDGGYEEYMVIPAMAVRCGGVNPMPENMSFEEASMAELLACAINGQKLSEFQLGQKVLIIGSGPVGILHAQLACSRGCGAIYLADVLPEKLEMARKICGSGLTGTIIFTDNSMFIKEAMCVTEGYGFDQVMVCCSATSAQQVALEIVAKCGCVNFFGGLPWGKSEVRLDTNHIHYKQCRLVGTHGSSALENRLSLDIITSGRIKVKDLITHHIGLSELEDALSIKNQDAGHLKTVVTF